MRNPPKAFQAPAGTRWLHNENCSLWFAPDLGIWERYDGTGQLVEKGVWNV